MREFFGPVHLDLTRYLILTGVPFICSLVQAHMFVPKLEAEGQVLKRALLACVLDLQIPEE